MCEWVKRVVTFIVVAYLVVLVGGAIVGGAWVLTRGRGAP